LLTTYGKQDDVDDPQNSHHLRQCLEAANSTLIIFNFFTRSFGDGHVITSQAYTVYIAASVFLLQVQATKDFTSQAMENLKYCVDALERIKATSPGMSGRCHQILYLLTIVNSDWLGTYTDLPRTPTFGRKAHHQRYGRLIPHVWLDYDRMAELQ
jgi:hypothetical protein